MIGLSTSAEVIYVAASEQSTSAIARLWICERILSYILREGACEADK